MLLFCYQSFASAKIDRHQLDRELEYALDHDSIHQEYLDFFEEIYKSMEANYYKYVQRLDFDRFVEEFDNKIYKNLRQEGKSSKFIRWRSAAYLVDFLKADEDIFSAFYPPKPAKEYEENVLGKKIDLGIEGEMIASGFQVTYIEPRSDAYLKGLRENDLIIKIKGENVNVLSEEEIRELLVPLADTVISIAYINHKNLVEKIIDVKSLEYFRQTVFLSPISLPGIYCLEIRKFNRKTSDDLFRYLTFLRKQGEVKGLILDLRDNPGGPPLAAREISSFFLPGKEPFAVFKKKDKPIAVLDVPQIPDQLHYDGPMVILVNKKSGSASELFSGILQKRGRAILLGTRSAGQVMLKSMYHFDDESMLLLVTARGHHPDGGVFSFQGLIPNRLIEKDENDDLVKHAAIYLNYIHKKDSVLR